ncbi:MAG: glycosyltransferase family 2 protein [Coriobacteriia bacterium]|nr:glycosyltransferase family 2 protein [Coriobacteriia bacterium]
MSMNASDRRMDVAMGLGAPDDPVDVTIILPAYNEEDSVDGVYAQVVDVLEKAGHSFEILFVDDGSNDATWPKVKALATMDSRVRGLRHRRNFGKAAALANGFTYARGEIMVICDADMQYDPNDIIRMIDKVIEGWDVATAYKVVRRDPLSKRIPSWFFNFFVRSTTGVKLHDINAGLKAFTHQAADDLIKYGYGELHRFFIILAARKGYSVCEVPVESLYRTSGSSKYGMERYMRGALDFLTVFFLSGYGDRPLHLLGGLGAWFLAMGTAVFAYLGFAAAFMGQSISGKPSLILGALFLITGIQLLVFGLLAEMINNLERPQAAGSKIAQVVRIDRRSAIVLAPGVQVERRKGSRDAAHAPTSVPQPAAPRRRASDRDAQPVAVGVELTRDAV